MIYLHVDSAKDSMNDPGPEAFTTDCSNFPKPGFLLKRRTKDSEEIVQSSPYTPVFTCAPLLICVTMPTGM